MNPVNWISAASLGHSSAVLLIAKLTALLVVAWLLDAALRQANPRWRVLSWRASAAGALMLAALAVCPPLLRLSVLPSADDLRSMPVDASDVAAMTVQWSETSPLRRREMQPADSSVTAAPTRALAASTPAASSRRTRSSIGTSSIFAAIWLAGATIGFGITAIAFWRLTCLLRRTSSVPAKIAAVAAQVATELRLRRSFELRQTAEVESPCIVGVWRPTILLPERQCRAEFAAELPAILAHELAHLRGGDLIWNHLFGTLSAILWFHPLVWRMRAAHANACDGVCDAIAADYVGDARQYGQTLARLSLRIAAPRAVAGLAMARKSGVRRRIEAVQRYVFRSALPRRPAAGAIATAAIALTLFGGVTLTRTSAEPPLAVPVADRASRTAEVVATPATKPASQLTFRAVSADANEPLAGVNLKIWGGMNGQRFSKVVRTDSAGHAAFDHDPAAQFDGLSITATKSGFAPIGCWLRDEHSKIVVPAHLELRFRKGIEVGGVVQDKGGKPIEGARVALGMTITWPDLEAAGFTPYEMTTGPDGRWLCDGAPQNTSELSVRISHPDYIDPVTSSTAQPNLDHVTVLEQGLQVTGRVTDPSGGPVARAHVFLGLDRFNGDEDATTTYTDAEGRFTLKNAPAGRSMLTVKANSFSPTSQNLTVGEHSDPVDFRLEPGHTLRVRIVDVDGKPLEGVWFASDTWRGMRALSFRADSSADGLIEWTGAPPDTVLYDMGKRGYMSSRRVTLQADGKEHVLTMYRPLEISGHVTDARTGKPIDEFVVRHGQRLAGSDRDFWSREEALTFSATDGRYRYSFDEPTLAWLLEVEAPGYEPARSRQFKSDEGQVTYDFQLEPGQATRGVVVLPDGSPAVGADICLATEVKRAFFDRARIDQRQNRADVVTTDTEGRFSFGPQGDEPFMIFALHDDGYADATEAQFRENNRLVLKPWGQIEGQATLGDKPDAGREINYHPTRGGSAYNGFLWSYGYETNTDAAGHFAFGRVLPGDGSLGRVLIVKYPNGGQTHYKGWNQKIEVQPRATTKATIGGTGRPVAGRVQTDRPPSVELDWTTNEPAELNGWDPAKGRRLETFTRYLAPIDRSGAFVIPDVPAGDYKLTINVNIPPLANSCGAGEAMGKLELDVHVPEMPGGRSDEPIDLGTVTATLFDTLDAGEVAPDFAAVRLDGDMLRMSDLVGKVVVLDFWATWCGPCVAEMPAFQAIHEQFGGDGRFALVSVSCDNDAREPRELVKSKGYDWPQAYTPGTNSRMAQDYTVRSLPTTYLIGADGHVLAVNLRGEPLKQAITAALVNGALFNTQAATRPARYPVTRFEPPQNAEPLSVAPAIVVADDTDPNYEAGKPHTDRLRLLAADGQELWSHQDLNNCQTVGARHGVAIDRQRGRIYVREIVAKRLSAYDLDGNKLWQIERADADTLAVDPNTGNLWTSGGSDLKSGETVVFDPQGNEVVVYPFRGIDLEYDPHDDAFWLAGYEIIKLSRQGEVLFRKPVDGWCCPSLSVNRQDGSVWVVERDHPDVSRSKNRLWLLAADGSTRQDIDLGEQGAFVVACEPDTGVAWLGGFGIGLRRVATDGTIDKPLAVEAHNIAISPTTGDVWVATDAAVLRLDRDGQVQATSPFAATSQQSWLAAF